jgi:hypothetical protein
VGSPALAVFEASDAETNTAASSPEIALDGSSSWQAKPSIHSESTSQFCFFMIIAIRFFVMGM